jgi:multicomponent Na+:H+ antiporter subunit F
MIETVADIALATLGISSALVFVRFLLGPRLEDRVVALDLLTTIIVCTAAVYALRHGATVLLDVAIVFALVSFIATVAFARWLRLREAP